MRAGFVYILINASMPSVVKVGKTERDPEGRAKELSGVTGVPTPFVVVYHEFFDDCSVAEAYVHTLLEAKGFRVATNREFFSAPAEVAIRALIQAKTALGGKGGGEQAATANAATESSGIPQSEPWEGILADAIAAHRGSGDTLQDYAEAARLYEQAAKLGSAQACYELGAMHADDLGGFPDADKRAAVTWLKEGARRGYAICYAELSDFYYSQAASLRDDEACRDIDLARNAGKCWAKYREAIAGHEDAAFWRRCFFHVSFHHREIADMDWYEKHAEQIIGAQQSQYDKLAGRMKDQKLNESAARHHAEQIALVRRLLHYNG